MTAPPPDQDSVQPDVLQFDDNSLLPLLYGEHDQNLARIERQRGEGEAIERAPRERRAHERHVGDASGCLECVQPSHQLSVHPERVVERVLE